MNKSDTRIFLLILQKYAKMDTNRWIVRKKNYDTYKNVRASCVAGTHGEKVLLINMYFLCILFKFYFCDLKIESFYFFRSAINQTGVTCMYTVFLLLLLFLLLLFSFTTNGSQSDRFYLCSVEFIHREKSHM
jgi:hypothetical protein